MIVLNLQCGSGHAFEGWFASNEVFDQQMAKGDVCCPMCNNAQIVRLPSGPRVARTVPAAAVAAAPSSQNEMVSQVITALAQLAAGAEDVSTQFASEARKIHYGDAEPRNIKGQATLEETSELLEEGIVVLPVPDKESIH